MFESPWTWLASIAIILLTLSVSRRLFQWYFGITERLAFLEHEQKMHWEEIQENDDWIDEWKPPESVKANIQRVRELELRIAKIETLMRMK